MAYKPSDTLLEKYRIEALIGRGAFAEVYRATHLSLNAPRALKILRKDAPGLGSTEYGDFKARFQLEAQLGARLGDHPNIIQVHDFEQDGETLILVMEYAQGGSLSERLAKLRDQGQLLLIDEAVQIALDVAQGLSAIHALDAVHRDIKPSNILFDKKGRAKVADVGLAQIPGGPSMRSQLSQPLRHPGTAGYMSPEQESLSNYLTPASDVYALGLVLFEMLTGRVYRSQRPGTRAGELRHDLPTWLDDLLARLLAVKPEVRPWNGAEVAGLLREGAQQEEAKRKAKQAERQAKNEGRLEEKQRVRLAVENSAHLESQTKVRQEVSVQPAVAQKLPQAISEEKLSSSALPFLQRLPAWAWIFLGGSILFIFAIGIILLINVVSHPLPVGFTETPSGMIHTVAAQTVAAQMARSVQQSATNTPQPTVTPIIVLPSPSFTNNPTEQVVGGDADEVAGCDNAVFISDMTIPDGKKFNPGDTFTKTWLVMNSGSCVWTTEYSLYFVNGDEMGGINPQNLTTETPPGFSSDISIQLVAPSNPGTYTGYWQLKNADGIAFGHKIYLQIMVVDE